MRYLLILAIVLSGCLRDAREEKPKNVKPIKEITSLLDGNPNANSYYWLFKIQADNIRKNPDIDAGMAERIGTRMVENMELKKGAVPGLAEAIQEQLQPWAGTGTPKDWPDGYCDMLDRIAESCRRAAK